MQSRWLTPLFNRISTTEIIKTNRLTRELHQTESRIVDLQSEAALMEREIYQYHLGTHPDYFQKVDTLIGLSSKAGVGLEIMLRDGKGYSFPARSAVSRTIHNIDLVILANQLWAAGAEAVAINGERLTSRSGINCAGPVILVNGTRVAPPFIVQALGPSERLHATMTGKQSYLRHLAGYGIQVDAEIKQVALPSYTGEV